MRNVGLRAEKTRKSSSAEKTKTYIFKRIINTRINTRINLRILTYIFKSVDKTYKIKNVYRRLISVYAIPVSQGYGRYSKRKKYTENWEISVFTKVFKFFENLKHFSFEVVVGLLHIY